MDKAVCRPAARRAQGEKNVRGSELKAIRQRLGMTASEFAAALGFSGTKETQRVQIARYEHEVRPILPWIAKLARAYFVLFTRDGITPDDVEFATSGVEFKTFNYPANAIWSDTHAES